MKKRILAVLMIFVLMIQLSGCGLIEDILFEDEDPWFEDLWDDDEDWDDDWDDWDDWESESSTHQSSYYTQDNSHEDSSAPDGLSMEVSAETGEMLIDRPQLANEASMGEEGTWTIFVYLCGTDLESDFWQGGAGTTDLEEMKKGVSGDKVQFVVETGGTNVRSSDYFDRGVNQRFLVKDGKVSKVGEVSRAGMGRIATLIAFLEWGIHQYPAEHMGVIFWNHGGGSITGVCFDELEQNDSLSLTEMNQAFRSVFAKMTDRFEFIGFDACLMGSIEAANILASYADYMIGSVETEPGGGWDYEAIGKYLSSNPKADGLAVGKVICDSFMKACQSDGDIDLSTLSVIDLRKVDDFLIKFNTFAHGFYDAGSEVSKLTEMVRGIESADNFGGNNKSEGYTNMVDLAGIIRACGKYGTGTAEVLKALEDCVVYKVSGSVHRSSCGLSMYYPLEVQGSSELKTFAEICISPYYLSFVDRQAQGNVLTASEEEYEDDTWFDEDGLWNWFWEDWDEDYEDWDDYEDQWDEDYYPYEDYFAYADVMEVTGESPLITFKVEPQFDENGYYYFILDESGLSYAADVYAYVFEMSADEMDFIELGETYDIYADWKKGEFADNMDGYWLSLPDGQNLATYIVQAEDDSISYTSPIYYNGEQMFLRLRQNSDWSVVVEGVWEGIDESGAAGRNLIQLKDGDVIIPRYYSYTVDDFEEGAYMGEEYKVRGTLQIYYDLLEPGDYYYMFCIDDIYNDYYLSDAVIFTIDEEGGVWF